MTGCLGRGAAASILASAILAGAPAPASAQEAAIAQCRAMASDADRIACLEEALRDDVMGRPEAEDSNSGGGLRLPSISVPFFGGDDDDDPAVSAPAPAPAAPAPVASAEPEAEEFGAEQVAATRAERYAREDSRRMQAMIVSASANHRGLYTMELDNGQVWLQAERSGVPLRLDMSEPQPVEISRSGFGGYRMKLMTPDRMIPVRRAD